MPTVQLYDNNHSGLTADITFSAITGGSSSLGTQTIPYVFVSDMPYGTYSLYYSQWGQTCTTIISGETLNITVDTNINANVNFYFGSNNVNQIFTLIVDWGDGTPLETFSGNYGYYTPHSYTVAPGLYTIKVLSTINQYINLISASGVLGVTEINNLGGFNQLTYLDLSSNVLTTLDISNNTLINNLSINNNQLDVNSVNNILISLSGENISNGYVNTSSQTPSACPTGLGNDAKNYLKYSLGWNVLTDICLTEYVELIVTINSPNYVVFYINGFSIFNMVIDWGDGSPLDYSYQGSSSYNPFYYYSTQPLPIKIYFDFPLSVNSFSFETAYGPVLNGVNNLSLLSNLDSLDFTSQLLSSIDLTGLNLLTYVYLINNYLPTNVVNNVLETLSGNSVVNGILYLYNQTPPACPTGNGIIAQNHLVNDLSWNVQVDTGCP